MGPFAQLDCFRTADRAARNSGTGREILGLTNGANRQGVICPIDVTGTSRESHFRQEISYTGGRRYGAEHRNV